jgi:hypothetical protein
MAQKERKTDFRREDRLLIFATMMASSGWILHLNVSYVLAPESCDQRSKWMLHGLTIGCLVITAIAAAIAWRLRAPSVSDPEVAQRIHWMALATVVFSVALSMVIVAQEIPNLILRSCD